MTDPIQTSDREDMEMLLPFYAMGKLDAADTARVEAYLAAHPDMRVQLALIEDERIATVVSNEAISPPPSLTADALLAKLPKSATAKTSEAVKGAFGRLADIFRAPDAAVLRWAAAALVALVAAQSIVVGNVLLNQPAGYELASGGEAVTETGSFALVRFRGDATLSEIRSDLKALDLEWVSPLNRTGLATVRISEASLSSEMRNVRIQTIKTKAKTIDFITPKGGR